MMTSYSETTLYQLLITDGVLLPSTRLEYHLLEPSRRTLVRRAFFDSGRLIVRPKDEEFESDIATLAEIVEYAEPSSVRAVAVLRGLRRVRIEDVYPNGKSALVTCSPLEEEMADQTTAQSLASDVLGTMSMLAGAGYDLADRIGQKAAAIGDISAIADIIGSVTFDRPAEHRRLLQEPNIINRLRMVHNRLVELIQAMDRPTPPDDLAAPPY
jgi:Lon protease-like protein